MGGRWLYERYTNLGEIVRILSCNKNSYFYLKLLFSEHPEVHFADFPFLWNDGVNFITHQPFYSPPMRTSTRPWCRPVFTQLQRRGLEKRFQATKYVTKRERLQIGAMLGLSETQVKVWFQNRRTKWRHEAAKKAKKEDKQDEQTSLDTNNCVQKGEVKNEKEKEDGCDESVLKKTENSP